MQVYNATIKCNFLTLFFPEDGEDPPKHVAVNKSLLQNVVVVVVVVVVVIVDDIAVLFP